MDNNIEKALMLVSSEDYQVSNIEKFSHLYYFLNILKKKVTELEKQVRKKGSALMINLDLKRIDYGKFDIIKIDPTEIEEYNANSVIEGLGMERAIAFLKVDSKITAYLKKASAMGAVTIEEIEKCRRGIKKKPKIGYLKIQSKKNGNTL